MNAEVLSAPKKSPLKSILISNITVVLLLFFIDEGAFNFRWMSQPGNWFAFFIYFSGIFLCQYFVYAVILRKYKGKEKNLYTSLIGIPLGLIVVIVSFYALMNL